MQNCENVIQNFALDLGFVVISKNQKCNLYFYLQNIYRKFSYVANCEE